MRLYSTVLGQQGARQSENDSQVTSYGLIQVLFKHLPGETELNHRKTTSVTIATVMAKI
jgi:hypothetical protein